MTDLKIVTEAEAAWTEFKRLRAMLEQTMSREQRRELDALVWAYRTALLLELKVPADRIRERNV